MIISFPHIADYCLPISVLLRMLLPRHTIQPAPPTTARTLELGARHSPDFVCLPFKYNLGNYIEALEAGADVLIQAGGGCRYGFYAELQQEILRNLGYKFEFINLFEAKTNPIKIISVLRRLQCRATPARLAYCIRLAAQMTKHMDRLDFLLRQRVGFEVHEGDFAAARARFFHQLEGVRTFSVLNSAVSDFEAELHQIPTNKPKNLLRVGMIGELYTLMEPFANFFMEKELARNHIEIYRYINMTYLLFQKTKRGDKTLARAGKYLKYTLGADGTDSVARALELATKGASGLIHVKPFGCTPEVNAMPVLMRLARDFKIPIIYLSFDSQTTHTGVKTRLEAFVDMLCMRENKEVADEKGISGA